MVRKYYRGKKRTNRGWLGRNVGRATSALRKRYMPGGKLSLAKVASDAKYALSIAKTARGLLNTEKKRHELNYYNQAIGQINGQANNGASWEITPLPSQGTGFGNRTGASISFRSACINMQLYPQGSTTHPIKIDFYVIQTKDGNAFDVTQFMQYNKYLFALNGVAIYDSHCQRDPDFFNEYTVIRKKTVYMPVKVNTAENRDCSIKLNFGRNGRHIRFNDNSNTPQGNRFFLVALASCGNTSSTVTSTLQGVQALGTNTGCVMQMDCQTYYLDN